MPSPKGPQVPAKEDAYRAVLYPVTQWVENENRPSSALFDDDVLSVNIVSKTTVEATIARFHSVFKLVQINCGAAREIGFDTRDELDEKDLDNLAHAHVYFINYDTLSNKTRKKTIRKLLQHETTKVVDIPAG